MDRIGGERVGKGREGKQTRWCEWVGERGRKGKGIGSK